MSVVINADHNKLPLGLGGQYPSYLLYYLKPVVNALNASNGVTTTYGMFYPVNYANPVANPGQTTINNNVSAIGGFFENDTTATLPDASKIYKIGKYQNIVKRLQNITLQQTIDTTLTLPTVYSTLDNCIEVGDGFVTLSNDASGLRVQYHRVDGDNTITSGAVAVLDATAGTGYTTYTGMNVQGAILDQATNKVVVAYINGATPTLKTLIVTVDTGTLACSGSSPHTTSFTGTASAFSVYGIRALSTTSVGVMIGNNGNGTNHGVYATTITGSSFSDGALATLGNTANSSAQIKNRLFVFGSDTLVAGFYQTSYTVRKYSVSGNTATLDPTTISGTYSRLFDIGSDRYIAVGATSSNNPTLLDVELFELLRLPFANGDSVLTVIGPTTNDIGIPQGDIFTCTNGSGNTFLSITDSGVNTIASKLYNRLDTALSFVKHMSNFYISNVSDGSVRNQISIMKVVTNKTVDVIVDGNVILENIEIGAYGNFTVNARCGEKSDIEIKNKSVVSSYIYPVSILCYAE